VLKNIRAFATSKAELDVIVKNNKVVVFMKGVPEEPRCGFSNAVVQIMRMHGVTYDSHDVLKDEELRQGNIDLLISINVNLFQWISRSGEASILTICGNGVLCALSLHCLILDYVCICRY
jgi:hypothetical protein